MTSKLTSVDYRLENQHLLDTCQYIFTQHLIGEIYGEFDREEIVKYSNVFFYPSVTFTGYHPDAVYIDDGKIKSSIGDYHSAIIVLCYLLGFSQQEAIMLFNPKIYEQIGYSNYFSSELERIENVFKKFEISDCADVLESFSLRKMMHTPNHPKLEVLEMVAKKMLSNAGISFEDFEVSEYLVDNFKSSTIFPIYPGLLNVPKFKTSYTFKAQEDGKKNNAKQFYNLKDFAKASYDLYSNIDAEHLTNPRFTEEYLEFVKHTFDVYLKHDTNKMIHPYKGKPDYYFWKKSISRVARDEVDPVVSHDINIGFSDKIATAGSCFAQHIAKALSKSGYNYFVSENAPAHLTEQEAIASNYGTFSARYGNLYTTKQLLQIFERAFGNYAPDVESWIRPDGKFVDPFRPQIQDNGFDSLSQMLDSQIEHLEAVKNMFLEADIFYIYSWID